MLWRTASSAYPYQTVRSGPILSAEADLTDYLGYKNKSSIRNLVTISLHSLKERTK